MAFEGDLSNLGLGDVLQTIAMSRQVGTFILRGEEERRLACGPQGVALLSARKSLGLKIGTVLVGSGKITQAHLDQALKLQARSRDLMLGQILVEQNACSAEDVRAARRYLAAEEIFTLFQWTGGQFEFQDGQPDMTGPFADLWFDVPSLAMEAARRLDEMPRIVAAVPVGEVFVAESAPDPEHEQMLENRDIARLYHLCDGSRTVHDILDVSYRARFDTLKGLQTLREAGLVRIATKDEITAAGRAAMSAKDHARAARLFRRASAYEPDDDGLRQDIADALRDAGDKRQAAEEFIRIGNARLAAGRDLPAIESFRVSVRLDSANPAGYEGLARALGESGLANEAAEAAATSARLRIANGDFEGAKAVAELGLEQRSGDPQLLVALANAQHGLGNTAEALKLLEESADRLEKAADDPRRLLEVYRRIVQIDPERKDCLHKADELQAVQATRRKRLLHRLAIAGGVLVLATAAVPFVGGASAASKLQKARELVEEAKTEEAREILAAIDDASLTPEELAERAAVAAKIEAIVHPPENTALRKKFAGSVDELVRSGSDAIQEERVADGLTSLLKAAEALDGTDGRKMKAMDSTAYAKVKADALKSVQDAVGLAAGKCQKVSADCAALLDRFTDDVWKREDLDMLHDLIAQSSRVLETTKADDWTRVPDLVQRLVAQTQAPKDGSDRIISESAAAVAENLRRLGKDNERAVARARRKELKESYKACYANGMMLERDGRIEEALAEYERFLARCEDLRQAAPAAIYAPLVAELLGGEMQLDQRIRTRRNRLAAIVHESDEAQTAETSDDVEAAFRIRRHLVHDNPDLDLSRRFRMPLRVETAPAGAEIYLEDGSPTGRALGRTPLVTSYPSDAGARFQARLDGYKTVEIVRKPGAEDLSGVERIELPKLAFFVTKAVGMTESPCAEAPGCVLTASRSGVVRRIDASSGEELARFEPGLLDGFAGSPVPRGDRVFVSALDGRTFVLGLSRLEKIAEVETGPVRATPLSTPRGVLVIDENGVARLLDDSGGVTWTRKMARVRLDTALAGTRAVVLTADAELLLVEVATGEVVRRTQLRNEVQWGPPAVRAGRVFAANDAGEIVCCDAQSLEVDWMHTVDGPVRGRVSATDQRVVVCTVNGSVHVLDAETGGVLSRTIVGGRVEDGICDLADGGYVAVTKKGGVTRFDAKGQVVWRFDAGEDIGSPPRLVADRVVFVTRKGAVVALTP